MTAIEDSTQVLNTIELRIKARPENLVLARLALAGIAEAPTAPPPDLITDFKVAVTEACTNAIKHAGEGCRENDDIIVRYTIMDKELFIDVEDFGAGFEPDALWPVSVLDPFPHGLGLGLQIIREFSDDFGVESGRGGSRVAFCKHFTSES